MFDLVWGCELRIEFFSGRVEQLLGVWRIEAGFVRNIELHIEIRGRRELSKLYGDGETGVGESVPWRLLG